MSFDFLNSDFQERAGAACAGMDTNIFYPIGTEGIAEAKAICNKCPIIQPCLQYALENDEIHGIWGGTSERKRKILVRQLGITVKKRPMVYPTTNENGKKRGG